MNFTSKYFFLIVILLVLNSCKEEKRIDPEVEKLAGYEKLGIDTKIKTNYEPLAVGSEAPDFSGTDQFGDEHNLSSLTQDSSLVMIFYRGQWCPICSRFLTKFAMDLDTLVGLGARVIAVTPETQENVEKTIKDTGLNIPIISDLDHTIMDSFNVGFRVNDIYQDKIRDGLDTDIAKNNGDEDAYLPIPATYIIGPDKKIKFVHYDPNYKKRASIGNIARHL